MARDISTCPWQICDSTQAEFDGSSDLGVVAHGSLHVLAAGMLLTHPASPEHWKATSRDRLLSAAKCKATSRDGLLKASAKRRKLQGN